MRTIVVPKRSRAIHALLEQAREEDILVQAGDGTQFLLSAVDDFAQEIEAQRRNKKLMALLDECAKETEWIPLEEVERQLGLTPSGTRKENRRRTDHRQR
jgi:hypothetical protein